jgi:hypothetical protein
MQGSVRALAHTGHHRLSVMVTTGQELVFNNGWDRRWSLDRLRLATKGVPMRIRLTLVLVSALVACGGSGGTGPGGDDDGTTPDGDTIDPPKRGFQLQSPDIDVPMGTEITYCWYFRTPNVEMLSIKRWQSHMTAGSHHMIMFMTGNTDVKPPGTVSSQACGGAGAGGSAPIWTYAAQNPDADLALPTDDGGGKPLGQEIAANQAGFLQMHYLNATDNPIKVHVTLNAEAYEASVAYTKTAAYVTYNPDIMIPKDAVGVVASQTCPTPSGAKFWMMSTHAHKQAVKTEVLDQSDTVFMSTDWEHPGAARFDAPTFRTFASDKLTYRCTYNNTSGHDIVDGDSAATNEMCMASGYYFPATGPKFCYGSFVIN